MEIRMTDHTRRGFIAALSYAAVAGWPNALLAQEPGIWSAKRTRSALQNDTAILLDIRSREEWQETGVAKHAWPISMHEKRFPERLFAAQRLAGNRTVALICATGGRTATVMNALQRSGYSGFVDVSEGMLGNRRGKGWIAAGFPIVSGAQAISELPTTLR